VGRAPLPFLGGMTWGRHAPEESALATGFFTIWFSSLIAMMSVTSVRMMEMLTSHGLGNTAGA
jgi:hypothetical protein